MEMKKELVQFSVQNNTNCDLNVPVMQQNVYSINATTKYSWNIQTIDLSCGIGSIVINSISYPFTFTANSLTSYLSALNELGFGFFCTETISSVNYLYTQDDVNIYGNITDCFSGPTTSTTTTTTTGVPTTSTTTTSTTLPSTSTTTTTTTGVPTTSTTTTSTTLPSTSTTTTTTTGVPTTSTTTTTTTGTPTTSTTTTTTTIAPTTSTTTSTTTAPPTTSTTTTTTTAAAGFIIRNVNGSGQIDNVYTSGGAIFYTINTGSFPVTNGTQITGLATLTSSPIFVDFSNWTSISCLSVYINGVLQNPGTTTISSSSTTWFVGNFTFTSSDSVLLEYNLGAC
jgi:hypothetical protein